MAYINPIIFFILTVFLHFISRQTINNLYFFLNLFTKKDKVIFTIISILYFPGTVIHEMAHFFMATILFLKVKDIKILPKIKEHEIKLGSVVFEKHDFLRGVVVGIAPFIFAFIIFYSISLLNLFPSNSILLNIIFLYLIYVISSTMFSSKQDLIDFIYLIPLFIVVFGAFYFFNFNINLVIDNKSILESIFNIFYTLNFYLFYSVIINLIILLLAKAVIIAVKK